LIPINTGVLGQALPASVFQAEPGAPQIRPVAAYYAPQSDFRLTAAFQKPPWRLLVTTNLLLTLAEKNQQMRGGFTLLCETEKLFAVDFAVPAGTPPVAPSLRNLGRVGRLRWLAGRRSPEENWDAFEDCLLDREWLPGEMHVVCITAVEVLLDEGNKFAETFWDVLRRTY
jgi:hypothetical protein